MAPNTAEPEDHTVPTTPRDYVDLFLAPVALQIDRRLEELAHQNRDDLHKRVVLETNAEANERTGRAHDVLESATHGLDLHGWTADWVERGIRLSHDQHSLVLGVPRNVTAYVEELPAG